MAGDLQLRRWPLVVVAAALGTVSAALGAAGCRQAPPQPPRAESADPEPLAKAREAMDRRDYAAAVDLLREALARRPGDLETHYRIGVSTSHLDRADEARGAFEWVAANGQSGAPEVQIARDWLRAQTAPTVPQPVVASPGGEARVAKPDLASLSGRAVGPEGARPRLQLFLKGLPGTPVQDEYHVLRTDQHGSFRFTDIVHGDYMLTNTVAGRPAWRLRVSLAMGERRVLDLSPANDATVRDDFPEPRR